MIIGKDYFDKSVPVVVARLCLRPRLLRLHVAFARLACHNYTV